METYMNKPEVKKRQLTCDFPIDTADPCRARCTRRYHFPIVQHADQPGLVSY